MVTWVFSNDKQSLVLLDASRVRFSRGTDRGLFRERVAGSFFAVGIENNRPAIKHPTSHPRQERSQLDAFDREVFRKLRRIAGL